MGDLKKMTISHVSDKIASAVEGSFASTPGTFDLNWGNVQSFSYTENENLDEVGNVGSGHTAHRIEPLLYFVTGSLTTRATKASIQNLLKACMGNVTDDATDYTAITDTAIESYTVKAQYNSTKVAVIDGLVFTNFNIEVSKGGYLVLTMDYIARKLTLNAETISTILPTDDLFTWLDASQNFGTALIAENFTISGDWNSDANEGRGIETSLAGERRLIKRVIKNNLSITGNYTYQIDETHEPMGYQDDPTSSSVALTASRGTDNEHVFTVTGVQKGDSDSSVDTDATLKTATQNFTGLDLSVVGDL